MESLVSRFANERSMKRLSILLLFLLIAPVGFAQSFSSKDIWHAYALSSIFLQCHDDLEEIIFEFKDLREFQKVTLVKDLQSACNDLFDSAITVVDMFYSVQTATIADFLMQRHSVENEIFTRTISETKVHFKGRLKVMRKMIPEMRAVAEQFQDKGIIHPLLPKIAKRVLSKIDELENLISKRM